MARKYSPTVSHNNFNYLLTNNLFNQPLSDKFFHSNTELEAFKKVDEIIKINKELELSYKSIILYQFPLKETNLRDKIVQDFIKTLVKLYLLMYSGSKPYGTGEEIEKQIYNILTYNIKIDIQREKIIYETNLNLLMHQDTLPDNFLTSLMQLPLLIKKTIAAQKQMTKGGSYNYKKKSTKKLKKINKSKN